MKPTRSPAILLVLLMVAVGCSEPTAQQVLERVEATYRDLETYKSVGTVVVKGCINGEESTSETSCRMLLKKPNLYLISWMEKVGPAVDEGAIWNDGTQAYYYSGVQDADVNRKTYHKVRDDRSAIASATGVSLGAARTIPSLFFPEFYPEYLRGFYSSYAENARIDRVEEVEGEQCYVITGQSETSKELTYWISKSRHFVVKNYKTYERPEGYMSEQELFDKLSPDDQERFRLKDEKLRKLKVEHEEWLKSHDVGPSLTGTHESRSTPKLKKADFQFTPPKDAVLKESLWDDTPVESPEQESEGK